MELPRPTDGRRHKRSYRLAARRGERDRAALRGLDLFRQRGGSGHRHDRKQRTNRFHLHHPPGPRLVRARDRDLERLPKRQRTDDLQHLAARPGRFARPRLGIWERSRSRLETPSIHRDRSYGPTSGTRAASAVRIFRRIVGENTTAILRSTCQMHPPAGAGLEAIGAASGCIPQVDSVDPDLSC